jgi:hypothetical protein
MAELPSIDDVLKAGRARERRSEIVLGLLLIGGGLAWRFGLDALVGQGQSAYGFGAVGIGAALVCHGAFVGFRSP